jgi:hypothetical protein
VAPCEGDPGETAGARLATRQEEGSPRSRAPELEYLTMGRCSYGDLVVIVYKGDTAMAHIGALV